MGAVEPLLNLTKSGSCSDGIYKVAVARGGQPLLYKYRSYR